MQKELIGPFHRELNSFFSNVCGIKSAAERNTLTNDLIMLLKNIANGIQPLNRGLVESPNTDYAQIRERLLSMFEGVSDKDDILNIALVHFRNLSAENRPHLEKTLAKTIAEAFEKMQVSDKPQITKGVADSASAGDDEFDSPSALPGDLFTAWLSAQLDSLKTDEANDNIEIIGSPTDEIINVRIYGSLPTQYAALSFLKRLAPDRAAPVMLIDPEQDNYTFQVSRKKAQAEMHQQENLNGAKHWLKDQGYNVSRGGKNCKELFVRTKAVLARNDDELRREVGISLEVADKLVAEYPETLVCFPSTFQIIATGKQKDQIKRYYKDAKVNGEDDEPKNFIMIEQGGQMIETDRSNISVSNADLLWPYFQRLAMLAKRLGLACSQMENEDAVTRAQRNVRGQSFVATTKMIQDCRPMEKDSSVKSHLAIESTARGKATSAVSASSPRFLQPAATDIPNEPMDETQYENRMQAESNMQLILGPEAFRLLLNLDTVFGAKTKGIKNKLLPESRHENTALVPYDADFISVFAYASNNGSDNYDSAPIAEYFLAVAEDIAPDLCQSKSQSRIDRLKGLAKNDIKGRVKEISDFFSSHSPFYFIKALSAQLTTLLNSPNIDDEAITELLLAFGVTQENLPEYQIPGTSTYNRQHIRFDALALSLTACLSRGILLPFAQLKQAEHPYLFDPNTRDFATQAKDCWIALEWSLDRFFKLGWRPGGSSGSYKTYDTEVKGILGTAGGSLGRTQGTMFSPPPPPSQTYSGGTNSSQQSGSSIEP